MIGQVIYALLGAALPLGMLSYLLFHWSLTSGRLSREGTLKDLKRATKRLRKESRKNKEKSPNPIHNKWMRLGGGFYGVMALWTYLVVELAEVFEFFMNFTGLLDMLRRISFDMIVGFIINSLINFISAIGWPIYWMDRMDDDYIILWLCAAYGGYLSGMYAARHPDRVEKAISEFRAGKKEV